MTRQLSIWSVFLALTALTFCGQADDRHSQANSISIDTTVVSQRFADNIPEPTGYINDYEDIFTDREEKILDSLVRTFEKQTTIEIAIVTLSSSQTTATEFDTLTFKIANKWGVGKKDKDNGILIGISSSLRTMRIRNGFGIEKVFSDKDTKAIIDSAFVPQFKKADYFEGTRQGVLAIIDRLK